MHEAPLSCQATIAEREVLEVHDRYPDPREDAPPKPTPRGEEPDWQGYSFAIDD